MKVIDEAWQDYVRKVLPAALGRNSVQYQETRMAFYAGAATLFDSLMKILGPGQEATESDLLIMDGINKELRQFAQEVAANRREPNG